jgi:hypothetical protein
MSVVLAWSFGLSMTCAQATRLRGRRTHNGLHDYCPLSLGLYIMVAVDSRVQQYIVSG